MVEDPPTARKMAKSKDGFLRTVGMRVSLSLIFGDPGSERADV
jgi:hypothetical protein